MLKSLYRVNTIKIKKVTGGFLPPPPPVAFSLKTGYIRTLKLLHFFNIIVLNKGTVFDKNWNFKIPLSLQPGGVNLRYFKLTLFDPTEITVCNTGCPKNMGIQ